MKKVLIGMTLLLALTAWGLRGPEYTQKKSKKLNLEVQISEQQKALEELIRRKNGTTDPATRSQVVEEMKTVHTGMQKAIQDYNEVVKELNYKYPQKDDDSERKYLPMRSRSLEQIEKEMGLDAVLSAAKGRVDKKYAPLVDEAKKREREERGDNLQVIEEVDTKKRKRDEKQKEEERLQLVR
ncbi:MAG: hypothetical protein IT288_03005 [Bdellovibrionales bacterium]|nr:hypothetical protein [Bdellovibrionales bacterium]